MRVLNEVELVSVSLVAEAPDPKNGVYAVHVVRDDGWTCTLVDCDGVHHYYEKVVS